ncbi:AAA family ATPase [Demequina sp.]|uniref:AAA family ATPase n=1 Tax=Demequina sp. TaxID=2050685 RepID=UPI003A8A352E
MASTGVILALGGRDDGALATAIDAHPRLSVVRRCADLAEALGAAQAGVGAVVVLGDHADVTRSDVAALEAADCVVVGVPVSEGEHDRLRSLGLRMLAAPGTHADEVVDLVGSQVANPGRARVLSDPPPLAPRPAQGAPGTIIAVWGPAGAPGRTTTALHVAAECAQQGRSTLVIDADTYGGAVAQAIGLADEVPGLAGAVREAQHGRVDAATISRYAVPITDRLAVLTGITRAARWPELTSAALEAVLEAARQCAQVVVVDCGFCLETDEQWQFDTRSPRRNGATLTALGRADTVVAVGSSEPLGIQRLIHGLEGLREHVTSAPVVVVTKVRASVAGRRPEETVADILTRFAGVERIHPIPWDPAALDAAALQGRLMTECAPRSPARRAYGQLASAVLAGTAVGQVSPTTERALPVGH